MSVHTHVCEGPIEASGGHLAVVHKRTDEHRRSFEAACSCRWNGPIRDKADFVDAFGRPGDAKAARARALIDLEEHLGAVA